MGLKLFKISDTYSGYTKTTDISPNPNKFNFTVLDEEVIGNYLIVKTHYEGCTTHNGNKIAVYEGIKSVKGRTELDPHFMETDDSPIARFPATILGSKLAKNFVNSLIFK